MSSLGSPKYKRTSLRPARLTIAGLAAVITAGDHAGAANGRHAPPAASVESRLTGEPLEPIMAVVSLLNQRITVYDAKGWILRAPVSSGQKGRETPSGIFSVIEKQAEHYSNLYDDAYMPHMQRITWSGIALHGGPLPGHPASHGCVRMPYQFARRLFDMTKLGMRVIVAPSDVAPVEIIHPALFPTQPRAGTLAAARAAEADEAASRADQARRATTRASQEAARAIIGVAENLKVKAEAHLAASDRTVASAGSVEADDQTKDANAAARTAELEAKWVTAKAELQSKFDAVASAREAAVRAENARVAAAEAAHKAALDLEPVSVFISRKTQRLYVRQAFQPILESSITIRDADRPIGTHVFTAIERTGSNGNMRWSAISLNGGHADAGTTETHGSARGRRGQSVESVGTDPGGAKAVLDRILIPQDALDRIAGIASPRSSLIISDEALSLETGKDTEFVVLMSGEPQGGIKSRRGPETEGRHARPRFRLSSGRSPFSGPYSNR
jgi:L,D-transpeptidase catalytic domain